MTVIKRAPWWAASEARYRLVAAGRPPLSIDLPGPAVTVTYEELAKHAGGGEVGAVRCTSRTFTTVETGGASFPGLTRLYTGVPQVIRMWPGDALRFLPVKPGGVEVVPLLVATADRA